MEDSFTPALGEVISVQAFIPSAEYIRKISVLTVETVEDVSSNLLGITDWSLDCQHCDEILERCPGHTGHAEMPIPVFRVFYVRHLLNLMSCICFWCQKLRLPKSNPHYAWIKTLEPKQRLNNLLATSKYYKRCGGRELDLKPSSEYGECGCGKLFPNFVSEDRDRCCIKAKVYLDAKDYACWTADKSWTPTPITPRIFFECLRGLPEETKFMLGVVDDLNLPESCLWDCLPITSHNTRPSHTFSNLGTKKKSYNDWTKLQRNIIAARNELREAMAENPGEDVSLSWYSLNSVVSKNVSECFQHGYKEKSEREEAKQKLKESQKKRTIGKVESCWRSLNKQVAAFHSSKHKKFANKGSVFGKPPQGVESRYQHQKMGRWRGYITGRRVNHAMRGVLEGHYHYRPDQIVIPLQRAMLQTWDEYVTRYNLKQVATWIANGPFIYPGANFVLMRDGTEIDLMYCQNRRDINLQDVFLVKRHIMDGDALLVNRQPTLHRNSAFGVYAVVANVLVIMLHYSVFVSLGADCDGDTIVVHVPQTPQGRADLQLCMVDQCIMKGGKIWVTFIQNTVVAAYLLTNPDLLLTYREMVDLVSAVDVWEFPKPRADGLYTGHSIMSLILPEDFTMEHRKSGVVIHNGKMLAGQLTEDVLNGSTGILNNMYRDNSEKEVVIHFIHQGYMLLQRFIKIFGLSGGYYDGAVDPRDEDRYLGTSPDMFKHPSQKKMSAVFQDFAKVEDAVTRLKIYSDQFPKHVPPYCMNPIESNILEHVGAISKMSCDVINAYHETKQGNSILHMIKSGAKGSVQTLNSMGGKVGQVFVMYKRFAAISSHFLPGRDTLHAYGFLNENYCDGISLPSAMIEAHAAGESVVRKNKGTAQSGYTVRKLVTCMMGVVIDRQCRAVDTNGRVIWNMYGNDGFDPQTLTDVSNRPPKEEGNTAKSQRIETPRDESEHMAELFKLAKPCSKSFRAPFRFEHLFLRCKVMFQHTKPNMLLASDYFAFVSQFWTRLVKEKLVVAHHANLKLWFFDWLGSENMISVQFGKQHLLWISQRVKAYLQRARIQAGESVGTLSTQETGEPFTQMSLKAPHFSGKFRQVATGPVRIANMVDGNFMNPTTTIFLKKSHVKCQNDADLFGLSLLRCTLEDICVEFPHIHINHLGVMLHFTIDRQRAIARAVSMREICRNLAMNTQMELKSFVSSFADEKEWFIRVELSFHSPLWSSLVKAETQIKKSQPDVKILANALAYNFFFNIVVHGLPNIENYIVDPVQNGRYVITALGSDLAKILSMPQVDVKRTTCTDCSEMGEVFGVMVARKSVEHEFLSVFRGIADERHIKLISRMMASDLVIKGMKLKQAAQNIPMTQRAAYEQCSKTMSEYCAVAEVDYGATICGAAFCNKLMNVGTGYMLETVADDVKAPTDINLNFLTKCCDYVFSFKADGLRVMLVFSHDRNGKKMCSLKDRNGTCYTLPTGGIEQLNLFEGTVLDGDLTHLKNDVHGMPCFIVHDILVCCGNVCEYLRYDQRIEIAREVVFSIGTFNQSSPLRQAQRYTRIDMGADFKYALPVSSRHEVSKMMFQPGSFPFFVTVKPVFAIESIALFDKIVTLSFPTDGYVLTSLSLGAQPFRKSANGVLKWKPSKQNTIDFLLVSGPHKFKRPEIPGTDAFRIINGNVGMLLINDLAVGRELILFSNLQSDFEIEDNKCYECAWNGKQWVPVKKRDKQANVLSVAICILNNIIEDLPLHELAKLSQA